MPHGSWEEAGFQRGDLWDRTSENDSMEMDLWPNV